MKKLLSLLSLTLILCLALSLPVLAANSESWDAYIAYAEQVIRENEEPDFVDMALGDLYAATETQANAEEFPFEMFIGAHGAMSYAQWQAANG